MRLLSVLFLLLSFSLGDSFKDGMKAFDTKNYKKAYDIWKPLAEKGDARAQYELANLYDGYLYDDKNEMYKWYLKSANQGYTEAEGIMAYLYENGVDGFLNIDIEKAIYWYERMAKKGNLEGIYNLGFLYQHGKKNYLSKDYTKAVKWYKIGANKGHKSSQRELANLYYSGNGVEMNKIKAYELWLKSAKQGDSSSQRSLDSLCKESPWACK